MNGIAADLKYALRSIRHAPAFYALVIGILALGIAGTVSVFGIVDGVLLRPLPYRDPERLAMLTSFAVKPPFDSNGSLPYADFEQIKSHNQSFEDVAVTYRRGWSMVTLTGGDDPQKAQGAFVSANFFNMFGRSPMLGRVFTSDENRRAEHVVVLGAALAANRFGSPQQSLGRDLEINGAKWKVIGVMPDDFQVPFANVQLWTPVLSHPEWNDKNEKEPQQQPRWDVVARLKRGTPITSAQAEINAIEKRLAVDLPETHKDEVRVVPLHEHFTGSLRPAMWVLLGAVTFLLLIACANVCNLLLARAASRGRELAVRTALGAGGWRLMRQLVTEGLLLSIVAGTLGIGASAALIQVLKALAPAEIPRLSGAGIDLRVVLFALAITCLTGVLLGLAPAWSIAGRDPRESLQAGGRTLTASREHRRLKAFLVTAEFALAMVLLTGAGLLIRSFMAVLDVDLGFRPEKVLTVRLDLPGATPQRLDQFYRDAMERIGALPGVQAIGGASSLFFLDATRGHALRQVEGRPAEPVGTWKPLLWTQVNGAYFQAMGISLVGGRLFNEHDRANSALVGIVNETLARRYWPGEDAVGKRLKGFDPRGKNDEWLTVVGVVRDMRSGGIERQPVSQIYEVQSQRGDQVGSIVIRTTSDPAQLAASVRTLIHAADPTATISSVTTMQQLLDQQEGRRRFQTWLIGVFSAIALALAALGVFAVMHYSVAARIHEIGIRMAIGAGSGEIVRMVVGGGAKLALAGIAAGTLGALWGTEAIAGMLFQVQPTDPASFVFAAGVLAAVAIAACYLPARRATRVDPMVALRRE